VAITGTVTVLALANRAVATSSQDGFCFDAGRRFGHIIDPRAGATPHRYARVMVTASAAATADALSTGFMLLDPLSVRRALPPDVTADLDEVSHL
jgi:thiamine biosynthesis lipoprotein